MSRARRDRPLVVYAEDEIPVQHLVEFWLDDAGFDVLLADDGDQALAMIREHLPDLVITDAMMPKLTGDELVEIMVEDPELCGIPIVMATAAASPLRVSRMLERGCKEVLAKPLDEQTFVKAAKDALEAS